LICIEHFLSGAICSNNSKLVMHVYGNATKCCAHEPLLYRVPFLIITLIAFCRAFLGRSFTLSPWVQMTPNTVCMFLAMTESAVHKNRNSTFFRCFKLFPFDFYRAVFVQNMQWVFLEIFPIYKFCSHSHFQYYFICEFCANALLITVKQKTY